MTQPASKPDRSLRAVVQSLVTARLGAEADTRRHAQVLKEIVKLAKQNVSRNWVPTPALLVDRFQKKYPHLHLCPGGCGQLVLQGPKTRLCGEACRAVERALDDKRRGSQKRRRAVGLEKRARDWAKKCGADDRSWTPLVEGDPSTWITVQARGRTRRDFREQLEDLADEARDARGPLRKIGRRLSRLLRHVFKQKAFPPR